MASATAEFARLDQLSALLDVAIADSKMVLDDKRYFPYWGTYHDSRGYESPGHRCAVCLAGAVMAQTLGAPLASIRWPGHFSGEVSRRLLALEFLRTGSCINAGERLWGAGTKRLEHERPRLMSVMLAYKVCVKQDYRYFSGAFDFRRHLEAMRTLHGLLVAEGL